jgi:hypothetical protein
MDRVGGFVERHPRLLLRLASWETSALAERLAAAPVAAPIYICGLARSGTTILLEALAQHPDVGSHQYRDYPVVALPYAWPWLLRYIATKEERPAERAHGDRIMVTSRSPEAMEEPLWRLFFPAPRAGAGDVLGGEVANPAFEAFYRAHVGKLLLERGRSRYLAKGNYNVTRIAYLRRLFPDARFVVPVRDPEGHVSSLARQHRRFTEGLRDNPRGRDHLRRVGHFEFGPDRRPIDTGAPGGVAGVLGLWAAGEEARGWARAWALVYAHVADTLARDPALAEAVKVVRYEDFCARPAAVLGEVFAHVRLAPPAGMVEGFAAQVSAPSYYDSGFTEAERAAIREETGAVAARFGYEQGSARRGSAGGVR